MLIAIARAPVSPQAHAGAARLAGLPPNEVTRRLTGPLPRVLLPAVPSKEAEAVTKGLEALGFVALACDAAAVPTDEDRIVARTVEFRGKEVVFGDGKKQYPCPARALGLIQRGMRSSMIAEKVHTAERRFDLGKAVLTGGLAMTSTTRSTEHRQREHREAMLLVQRNDGEPDIALYERRIDYRFLRAHKAPASVANLDLTLTLLRTVAPAAALDDRAIRPGFAAGLPLTSVDRLDLAFFLVSLARTRGC